MNTKSTILLILTPLALILGACNSQAVTPKPLPTPTLGIVPLLEPADTPTASPVTTENEPETTPTTGVVTENLLLPSDPTERLYALLGNDRNLVNDLIFAIVNERDMRFVPAFIELHRASQIGIVRNEGNFVQALEALTGQPFGGNWAQWIEWYGTTDITPPPGFTGWKGTILANIDPGFADFLQDDFASTIRVEEIVWGGVRVDGIPALDNPDMILASEADTLDPNEPVFGMVINGDARAYPLRYMDWHEMANDVIGGVPVSIAYCTLCGAAVAYDGRASDGTTYTFGSSGFLFRSNKLMYDRQTRTLWNQLTGEPVLGSLVNTNVTLDILPIVLTTWSDWQAQQPNTLVIAPDTGFERVYTPGAAYGNYFAGDQTMFPVWQRSNLLDTKEQIFALRLNNIAKAYPITTLTEENVVNDTVGETNVVLIATGDIIETAGNNLRVGPVTYQSGAAVAAYERGNWVFSLGDDGMLVDENGTIWQITPEALVSENGDTLNRLGGHLAYWFGWYAFFPQTQVYGIE